MKWKGREGEAPRGLFNTITYWDDWSARFKQQRREPSMVTKLFRGDKEDMRKIILRLRAENALLKKQLVALNADLVDDEAAWLARNARQQQQAPAQQAADILGALVGQVLRELLEGPPHSAEQQTWKRKFINALTDCFDAGYLPASAEYKVSPGDLDEVLEAYDDAKT